MPIIHVFIPSSICSNALRKLNVLSNNAGTMAFECSNTVLYIQLIDFSHVLRLITRENCSFTAMFFSLSPWNLTKESHNT